MKRSEPKLSKSAYAKLLSEVERSGRHATATILEFIEKRSIQAMKQNNIALLPSLDDVVKGLGISRGTIQHQLPYMHRDGLIERIGTPGKFRYAAKFEDIEGKL